jgi:hypothetical protein
MMSMDDSSEPRPRDQRHPTKRGLTLAVIGAVIVTGACTGDSSAVEAPTPGVTFAVEVRDITPTSDPESTGTTAPTRGTAISETGQPTFGSAPIASPASSPTTGAAPTTAGVILFRQGDEDPRIARVQEKLIRLDYLPAGSATGTFDRATNGAILRFQGDYGLVVDGLLGPQTETAINAAAASTTSG